MLSSEQLAKLLGRPLTSYESENIELYLDIATERLESMLCSTITPIAEERTYDGREGYSTVFTDFFTEVSSVVVDGETIDPADYSLRQWDRRNGFWFNSIVMKHKLCKDSEVVIDGVWGWDEDMMPADLQLLFAKTFALTSSMDKRDSTVKSKKVEDFSISFNDNSLYDQFVIDNRTTIKKYSLCNISVVRSGNVRPHWSL